MYIKRIFGFLALICFVPMILSHGFRGDTIVKTGDYFQTIRNLSYSSIRHKVPVCSYDFDGHYHISTLIRRGAKSKASCYITIAFDARDYDIECSPIQEFYRMPERQWVQAYQLKQGDKLMNHKGEAKEIVTIQFIEKESSLYALEIRKTHTFFVGQHAILTHNMFLPGITLGLGFAFGSGAAAGGVSTGWFGPLACAGGIAIGGIAGIVTHLVAGDRMPHYEISLNMNEIVKGLRFSAANVFLNEDAENAQAPGKPTEKDGFVPKKNWDGKKVRHPRGYGWPDNKGRIWIPTGNGGTAHGGPHWDVQHPGRSKDYDNVFPEKDKS